MTTGYCTLDDVRRALRKQNLPGDIDQDNQIAVDAIAGYAEYIEKQTSRHWFVSGGISEDNKGLFPTAVETRDDEYDLPTVGGHVTGAYGGGVDAYTATTGTVFDSTPTDTPKPKEYIRLATGTRDDSDSAPAYARITLDRKNVQAVNSLHAINADGGYDDWVASNEYAGGVGFKSHAGEDYWVRINNGGVSELYLNIHAMDDDLASLSNAVYVDIDHGYSGSADGKKIKAIRRATALLVGADLAEEAVVEIPENTTLYDIETKAEEMRDRANEILGRFR